MDATLIFIEENQSWIYFFLGILALIYIRLTWVRYQEVEGTYFSLERERARVRLIRAGMTLTLVLLGLASTFVVATFASPAVPLSARPTEVPTISLLSTPLDQQAAGPIDDPATPIPEASDVGCLNQDATIFDPANGDSISGLVEIKGTANIPGFAFYKIEVRTLAPDAVWRAISAGTAPVCETGCGETELLAAWDTNLVTAGEYQLQLVVLDTAGNAPLPCLIEVRVLPSS